MQAKETDSYNILFCGDVVGRPGRLALQDFLLNTNIKEQADFIIVNAENASHGFGLTLKNHNDLSSLGIDILTSGNHIWDKKEIFEYINESQKLIRPLNYPDYIQGTGYKITEKNGLKIAVINLLGKVFMPDIDSPWNALEKVLPEIKKQADIIFIDYHAEATAEKIAFGLFADSQGINAVCGTHTHVPTADEKILPNGCAYITDVGFCGATNSVIGMEFDGSYRHLRSYMPVRFEVAPLDMAEVNSVLITLDRKTSLAHNIKRIKHTVNLAKPDNKNCAESEQANED